MTVNLRAEDAVRSATSDAYRSDRRPFGVAEAILSFVILKVRIRRNCDIFIRLPIIYLFGGGDSEESRRPSVVCQIDAHASVASYVGPLANNVCRAKWSK